MTIGQHALEMTLLLAAPLLLVRSQPGSLSAPFKRRRRSMK